MMFLMIILMSWSSFIFSHTVTQARITWVDYPIPPEDETLFFLDSGLVLKIKNDNALILDIHSKIGQQNDYVFTYNHDRVLLDLKLLKTQSFTPMASQFKNIDYIPTTISSLAVARKYFREARYHDKDSQCFNRAMVWTYEWWRRHSLKSNKILIFFTRNYIRRFNFEWWFHIAPLVNVLDEEVVKERVMDIKYSSGPLSIKSWTDIFMKGNPDCPLIDKYSDYADHPYEGDCYLQRTHMYTYQPADLQMYEAWGYEKNDFILKEVQQAYREAMDEIVTIKEQEPFHEIY